MSRYRVFSTAVAALAAAAVFTPTSAIAADDGQASNDPADSGIVVVVSLDGVESDLENPVPAQDSPAPAQDEAAQQDATSQPAGVEASAQAHAAGEETTSSNSSAEPNAAEPNAAEPNAAEPNASDGEASEEGGPALYSTRAAQPEVLAKVSVESPALSSTNPNPVVVDGVTVPPAPRAGFRVLPYLQQPSSDGMTINFFSETGTQATVKVTGPGLPAEGVTFAVDGVANPVTNYQEAELKQGDRVQPGTVTGGSQLTVPQGTWIRAANAYKYSQRIADLLPDAEYRYTVTVDGYEHTSHFRTFPTIGSEIARPIHFIAFSDTETDQVGRVTYREWVKGPLAEGSEPRPDANDSDWVRKFGNNRRDGEMQLRYMLTEDQAQKFNNELIKQANPDMLIIAGDIVERGSWQTHWDEWFRYFAGDENAILDSIPVNTSLGNHEVYGYCNSADDCTPVIRARAQYNWHFDTHGSSNPEHRDAYHRVDYGPITVISLDSTNGTDQTTGDALPDAMRITGDDSTLTPDQYGTDTQNRFTFEQYERDFPKTVEAGWWGEGADPTKPDQPNFMPGTPQYQWLEEQLKDARDAGQVIILQWHHVAYSNGVHGTTMGHEHVDAQPGTPMRHLQPLLEKYHVAAVISGHDETFQASYVDEDGDGIGTYHWDVGVASDGLRGERMIKDPNNPDGPYIPLAFNTHSVWMAQRDVPEMWVTNENGVKHLVDGGKNYGYLDLVLKRYEGEPLRSGELPHSVLRMLPVAMFPILNDAYDVVRVEARPMESGLQLVYFDSRGNILDPNKLPVPDVIELPGGQAPGAQVAPAADGKPAGTVVAAAKADPKKAGSAQADPKKADPKKARAASAKDSPVLANTGGSAAGLAEASALLAIGGLLLVVSRRRGGSQA
ncbi:metallophosphoesterase family protein [Trueperella bialowiezensis]|uniref:Calcineurin-like phosphoesterase n=1 Tax=Trueperella bialowiezensis TaxID=312285 RepID=A0A3S4VH24_9ACTO|nr:metallophosphoesterase family protein [Trueperella bialowiezensis]VEI13909.1 Calcineurin-like phosphoesterase [Trueperella bialowiezensis]